MKRFTVAAMVGIVALAAVIGTATARTTHYPTTLDATGTSAGGPGVFIEYGRVHSPKGACRSNRTLKMVVRYPDGSRKVLDRDRSSSNGAYALVGDFTGFESGKINAARKRIGRPGHRRICDAGSVGVD
jgi:hypothetical protein